MTITTTTTTTAAAATTTVIFLLDTDIQRISFVDLSLQHETHEVSHSGTLDMFLLILYIIYVYFLMRAGFLVFDALIF